MMPGLPMVPTLPVVIVLAAGRGERFLASGGTAHKLDTLLDGKAVLSHTLAAVHASGLPWHLVRPEGGTGGMGESIAMGVQATAEAAGWLILPGDLPLVQALTLQRVAQALAKQTIIVPRFHQQQGHPVGFGRHYFHALASLQGDVGAAAIVREARVSGNVQDLPVTDDGIARDVDTRADLDLAQHLLRARRLQIHPHSQ